jgi:hypothetical protein
VGSVVESFGAKEIERLFFLVFIFSLLRVVVCIVFKLPIVIEMRLRKLFLDYFASHNHLVMNSSPLVPQNDPSLLFTSAGMVQFKSELKKFHDFFFFFFFKKRPFLVC